MRCRFARRLFAQVCKPASCLSFFLEQFLTQAMGVFGITRQAAIEQAVYDAVKAGKIQGPDDLDALAKKIPNKSERATSARSPLDKRWMRCVRLPRGDA